jgi:hypothetical protein
MFPMKFPSCSSSPQCVTQDVPNSITLYPYFLCPAGITKVDTQKYLVGKVLLSQNENKKYIYHPFLMASQNR